MPVHDWTRVDAWLFHDFHLVWMAQLQAHLNEGRLPDGFYALVEQHYGRSFADLLGLHALSEQGQTSTQLSPRTLRRSLAIRHVNGHRLVALVEIVSPGNKEDPENIEEFTGKILSALANGVHVLLGDLFPPGPYDPGGLHGVLSIEWREDCHLLPIGEPLTLASYVAGKEVESYLEHVGLEAALPEMPLFLNRERYVNVPLEPTYLSAYRGFPAFWRQVLEAPPSVP